MSSLLWTWTRAKDASKVESQRLAGRVGENFMNFNEQELQSWTTQLIDYDNENEMREKEKFSLLFFYSFCNGKKNPRWMNKIKRLNWKFCVERWNSSSSFIWTSFCWWKANSCRWNSIIFGWKIRWFIEKFFEQFSSHFSLCLIVCWHHHSHCRHHQHQDHHYVWS